MGLLSKASGLDFSEKLVFTDFLIKHNIKTCAIYESSNNIFFIKNSIGFDASSILSSDSTFDFWNGVCSRKNFVYKFQKEDNSINCMLQFFSYGMNEELEYISLYRPSDDKILLLVNKEITTDIISDFYKLTDQKIDYVNISNLNLQDSESAYKYEISLNEAVSAYNFEEQDSIKNEIYNRIKISLFDKNHSIRLNENKIRLFFLAPKDFNGDSFAPHLKCIISEIIDSNSNKLNISFAGASDNLQEIQLFMKVE